MLHRADYLSARATLDAVSAVLSTHCVQPEIGTPLREAQSVAVEVLRKYQNTDYRHTFTSGVEIRIVWSRNPTAPTAEYFGVEESSIDCMWLVLARPATGAVKWSLLNMCPTLAVNLYDMADAHRILWHEQNTPV